MTAGYLTFGSASSGFILNNYVSFYPFAPSPACFI